MSKDVLETDKLSRIVCISNKKNYCRVSKNEVKPKAFKPNSNGETSIFVTSGLSENDIWSMGEEHLCDANKVYGRADVVANVVIDLKKIKIDYNDNPEYHANLNWPEDKEEIQEMAQVLAANAECAEK